METSEKSGQAYLVQFTEVLRTITNSELVELFNQEINKSGWGTARASYLSAIHQQFIQRSFDISNVGDQVSLSFAGKVKLLGNKIVKI
jgi:hypothetical protein